MEMLERLPTSYDLVYTWDYESKVKELRHLYEKSKDLQWNAVSALKWDTDVDLESGAFPVEMMGIYGTPHYDRLTEREKKRLQVEFTSWILSQFLHGEQGALLATAQIVTAAPAADAKFYAATQVMDEARHVEVYDRYLRDKVGKEFPVNVHLKSLLDLVLQDSRWDMKYLGMQIMVEGLALAAFGLIHSFTKEGLIKEITRLVMTDEARHVAFGVLSLRGFYANLPPGELREREDFVYESARLMRDRFLADEVWEAMGMDVEECKRLTLESPGMIEFRRLLFSKIVPNLKRLDLLTPRVRAGFAELGVLDYETWEPSA